MTQTGSVGSRPVWREAAAIALLMTATLKIMANATISPALPALEASFADDPGAAMLTRFLVSAPSLTVVLVAPFAGYAADRLGRMPLLLAGIVLFVVSGSAGAYLPDLTSILISRLVLGVAVAMTATAQVALAGDLFHGERRSSFMGLQVAAVNFSGFLFISSAGLLAGLSPRLPFLVYLLPVFVLPLLITIARRQYGNDETASKQEPLSRSGLQPLTHAWMIPALSVGALTMVTVMLFFIMPSQLPFYLDGAGFDSASGTAMGLGALTLTGGAAAITFQHIRERLGTALTFGAGYVLMATGFALLAYEASWGFILPGAALVGAGYGLVQPAFLLLALQVAPPERRGRVSGIVTTSIFLGQVVSPLLLTPAIHEFGFPGVFLAGGCTFFTFAAISAAVAIRRLVTAG